MTRFSAPATSSRAVPIAIASAVLMAGLSAPASAQNLIGSYQAYLSSNDHFNSSGTRLRSAAAIIRQDRANFHKFGLRDPADESDSFFASKANRARMERMLKRGRAPRHIVNDIVNGTPVVVVKIYGRGSRGTYIVVEVPSR